MAETLAWPHHFTNVSVYKIGLTPPLFFLLKLHKSRQLRASKRSHEGALGLSNVHICTIFTIRLFLFYFYLLFVLSLRHLLVEQELLILPEHLNSPLVFSGVRITRSLVLCVCFVDRWLFFMSFFFLPLCGLFFFDLRALITPLISSTTF